jgi:choline dehydrogenase-like flavoprotein
MLTGHLTLRPNSVVHSIIYDDRLEKVTGVRVIDHETKELKEYFARVVFLNAATLNSNLILLNSTSNRFPNGLGNDNGLLGKFIAFHNYRGSMTATIEGPDDVIDYGRRPTAVMMPNFRNVYQQETDFLRGYMTFYTASRSGWGGAGTANFGEEFKNANSEPGPWNVFMMMQGENIPVEHNQVSLSDSEKDAWDIPLLKINVGYEDNDLKLMNDFLEQGADMLEKSGCSSIKIKDSKQAPGLDIHEMGGVRMGKDPKTSLTNSWNQLHACKNVFVTDGACMTSTGTQNPSLTFMALTARAVNFMKKEAEKGNI